MFITFACASTCQSGGAASDNILLLDLATFILNTLILRIVVDVSSSSYSVSANAFSNYAFLFLCH